MCEHPHVYSLTHMLRGEGEVAASAMNHSWDTGQHVTELIPRSQGCCTCMLYLNIYYRKTHTGLLFSVFCVTTDWFFHHLILPNYIWTWVQSNCSTTAKQKKIIQMFSFHIYPMELQMVVKFGLILQWTKRFFQNFKFTYIYLHLLTLHLLKIWLEGKSEWANSDK